jgi:iron complex transport system substrate-binding protein
MKLKTLTSICLVAAMSMSVLAGCGSTSTSSGDNVVEAQESQSVSDDASADVKSAFPVEIEHAYGTTVIEEKPENIVTLYDSNPDSVLALGIAPVGVSKTGYGKVDENDLSTWVGEAFADLGVEPNVFDGTDGIDFEAISDAQPDVILLPNSGISEEDYNRLSEIAPTVPFATVAYACTWKEELEVTAKVLGMEEEGAQIEAELEQKISDSIAGYSDVLEGKTAAFCYIDPADLSVVYVYMPLDPRAGFLEELGLDLPDDIEAMVDEGGYSVPLSSENIDVLNSVDIIVCYGEESLVSVLQSNDVMNTVPAIKNGAVVTISDQSDLYMGTYATPLSIPAVLDDYVGLLAEAAAKVQ